MTDSSTGAGRGDAAWPFDPTTREGLPGAAASPGEVRTGDGPAVPRQPSAAGADRPAPVAPERPTRRRPPLWALIAAGAALVAALVVVLVLQRPDAPADPVPVAQNPPEEVVVTLAPPTPTIAPAAREAGSAFFNALPDTVLGYALTEVVANPAFLPAGALESYRATYSDGGATQLVVHTGQWATPEAVNALLDATIADQAANGTPEQGTVTAAGADVGRFLLLERADGTGTVWWTNRTVLLQLDGPSEALRDVFTAFSL